MVTISAPLDIKRRDFLLSLGITLLSAPLFRHLIPGVGVHRFRKGQAIPDWVLHPSEPSDVTFGADVVALRLPNCVYLQSQRPLKEDECLILIRDAVNTTFTGAPLHCRLWPHDDGVFASLKDGDNEYHKLELVLPRSG